MKPKFIALNLLLAAAVAAVAWQARIGWTQAQTKRRQSVSVAVKPAPVPPIAPVPKPEAPPATKYADVAMKDLFSKDRNPTVVIEAPKPEPPKPMPPLPVVYGVLGLPSGIKAIMAERAGAASKPVREGDSVGPFKILALDTRKVTFGWEDKKVEKNIEDLIDRTGRTGGGGPAAQAGSNVAAVNPAMPPPGAPQQNQAAQNNPPPPPQNFQPGHPGGERGAPGHSVRACVQGDTTPAGTVVDGYRKTVTQNMFGAVCSWLPAQ